MTMAPIPNPNRQPSDAAGQAPTAQRGGAVKIDLGEATALYDEAITLIKAVFDKAAKGLPIDGKPITGLVQRICGNIASGDRGIVYLSNRATPHNYLYAQSVNVCILSILVGLGLGHDKEQLEALGTAGLLHDIGMVKVMAITQQPRRLTAEEYAEVRKHLVHGAEILQGVKGLGETPSLVCKAHHAYKERERPSEPLTDDVKEYAQIVGLVDIYVAMTQPRPYREAKSFHEVIRELIGQIGQGDPPREADTSFFDTRIVKTLVNQIGVYPIGSWVRLNTNEGARVFAQNPNFPLRPVVEILFDARGRALAEPKLYDLCQKKQLFFYIKEPLDINKLRLEKS